MHGGDLETAAQEAGHHSRYLLIEENEVAHDHGAVPHLLERRVRSECEPCLDRNTLHGDREVSSRHADAEDVARL